MTFLFVRCGLKSLEQHIQIQKSYNNPIPSQFKLPNKQKTVEQSRNLFLKKQVSLKLRYDAV